jgi:hypothetical protein
MCERSLYEKEIGGCSPQGSQRDSDDEDDERKKEELQSGYLGVEYRSGMNSGMEQVLVER